MLTIVDVGGLQTNILEVNHNVPMIFCRLNNSAQIYTAAAVFQDFLNETFCGMFECLFLMFKQ